MCLVHVDKELFIAIMGLLRSQVFQNIWRKMEGYEMMQDESPQWSKSKIKTIVDEILHSDYWTIFFLYAWQFYFLKNHIIIHSKNSNFYGFIGFYEKSAFFSPLMLSADSSSFLFSFFFLLLLPFLYLA